MTCTDLPRPDYESALAVERRLILVGAESAEWLLDTAGVVSAVDVGERGRVGVRPLRGVPAYESGGRRRSGSWRATTVPHWSASARCRPPATGSARRWWGRAAPGPGGAGCQGAAGDGVGRSSGRTGLVPKRSWCSSMSFSTSPGRVEFLWETSRGSLEDLGGPAEVGVVLA